MFPACLGFVVLWCAVSVFCKAWEAALRVYSVVDFVCCMCCALPSVFLPLCNLVVFVLEKRLVSGLFFAKVRFDTVWYRLNCGCFVVVYVVFFCLSESGCNSITYGAYTSPASSKHIHKNSVYKSINATPVFSARSQ